MLLNNEILILQRNERYVLIKIIPLKACMPYGDFGPVLADLT